MARIVLGRDCVGDVGDALAHLLARRLEFLRRRHAAGQIVTRDDAGADARARRDRGLLLGADRDLERAAADVDDEQPAGVPSVPAARGEEREPRLVVAGEHGDALPDDLLDPMQDFVAVRRVVDRRRRERKQLRDLVAFGELHRFVDGVEQRLDAGFPDRAVLFEEVHEPHRRLRARLRFGP